MPEQELGRNLGKKTWAGIGDLDATLFNRNASGDRRHHRRSRLVLGRVGTTTAFAAGTEVGSPCGEAGHHCTEATARSTVARGILPQWREF